MMMMSKPPMFSIIPSRTSNDGLTLASHRAIPQDALVLTIPRTICTSGITLDNLISNLLLEEKRQTDAGEYFSKLKQRVLRNAFVDEWSDRAVELTGQMGAVHEMVQSAKTSASACPHGRRLFWLTKSRMFLDNCNDGLLVFVPWADLCDHDPLAPVAYHFNNKANSDFELFAHKPVVAGQPVEISYGSNRHNMSLLASYGFCIEDNPHDLVVLKNRYHVSLSTPAWQAMNDLGRDEFVGGLNELIASMPVVEDFVFDIKRAEDSVVQQDAWRNALALRNTRMNILRANRDFAVNIFNNSYT